ncbi:MAG: hypothetical protein K0S07_1482 [Chlamydiales bacterium]|jgi:hypothetical protein|nr:hypothetical protein [Chlamydiales bacterium]
MIQADQQSILDNLLQNGYQPQIQAETNQLYYVHQENGVEFPVFIRIMEGGELVQLIGFLPCNFQEETLYEVARTLHMINREIDLPGFGMEEQAKTIFYRLMVPAPNGQIDEKLTLAYLKSIHLVIISFQQVIKAVASGDMTLSQVIEQLNQASAEEPLPTDAR